MVESRRVAFVTTMALLSFSCAYAETPAIKDCLANETCSVQSTVVAAAAMTTATTPKNVLKTTTVGGSNPKIVRYDVSGNDSKGSNLQDVVVQVDDRTVISLGGDKANSSGKATSVSSNVTVVVKPSVGKANATATETNLQVTNSTHTTSTSTTATEFTSVLPPKYLFENGAEVVRFVPYKYCHCDLIVSIPNNFVLKYHCKKN